MCYFNYDHNILNIYPSDIHAVIDNKSAFIFLKDNRDKHICIRIKKKGKRINWKTCFDSFCLFLEFCVLIHFQMLNVT